MCKIYKLKVLPRSSRMHNLTFIGIIYAFVLIGCTQICDCFDLRDTGIRLIGETENMLYTQQYRWLITQNKTIYSTNLQFTAIYIL